MMTGKRFLKIFVAMVFVILAGFTVNSYAAMVPDGEVCFSDDFGATWVLNYSGFGTSSYQVTGYRLAAADVVCNGTTVEPLTGTAILVSGNNVVLGALTLSDDVNALPFPCTSVTWTITVSLDTLNGVNGTYTNMFGSQNPFGLTNVACTQEVLMKQIRGGITNDPVRILKSNK